MSFRCYELRLGNRSIGLISSRNRTKVLQPPPGVAAVAPATKSTLKLKPMLILWLTTAGPMLSVCVAACDLVAAHCFAWLWME